MHSCNILYKPILIKQTSNINQHSCMPLFQVQSYSKHCGILLNCVFVLKKSVALILCAYGEGTHGPPRVRVPESGKYVVFTRSLVCTMKYWCAGVKNKFHGAHTKAIQNLTKLQYFKYIREIIEILSLLVSFFSRKSFATPTKIITLQCETIFDFSFDDQFGFVSLLINLLGVQRQYETISGVQKLYFQTGAPPVRSEYF